MSEENGKKRKLSKLQKIADENCITVNEILISICKSCNTQYQASEVLGLKQSSFSTYLKNIGTNWTDLKKRAHTSETYLNLYDISGINLEALNEKLQEVKIIYMNRPIKYCDKCGSLVRYMWGGVSWCIAGGHTFYCEEILEQQR